MGYLQIVFFFCIQFLKIWSHKTGNGRPIVLGMFNYFMGSSLKGLIFVDITS